MYVCMYVCMNSMGVHLCFRASRQVFPLKIKIMVDCSVVIGNE